jgi:hypothetical protein
MPTLYFPCPQCDRPLDADPALDGPTIQCPCCDRVVEVPHPRALGRPAAVWLAVALTALLPATAVPGLIDLVPEYVAIPVVAAGTAVCLIPAVGLFRGKRAAWGAALALGIAAAALGIAAFVFVIPLVLVFAMDTTMFLDGIVPATAGGVLLTLLLFPACRAWCDR